MVPELQIPGEGHLAADASDQLSAEAPRTPGKRGPKRRRFTKTQESILRYLAGETALNGGVSCTKQQLADLLGRNVKTIDRSLSDLRRQGLVEARTNFDENGAQVSNTYRVMFACSVTDMTYGQNAFPDAEEDKVQGRHS